MVADAGVDMTMPFGIALAPGQEEGPEPPSGNLLPYRSHVRDFLPRAEILKDAVPAQD